MLQIFVLIVCPALLTVISFLYWELSKAKSTVRSLTNELMAARRKLITATILPVTSTSDALDELKEKGMKLHFERLVADGCMRQVGFSHALLRADSRSKIIELIFLDEITPIVISFNKKLINALKKYEIENEEEKMN